MTQSAKDRDLHVQIEEAARLLGVSGWEISEVAESYSSVVRILRSPHGEELVLKLFTSLRKFDREVAALTLLDSYDMTPRIVASLGTQVQRPAVLMTRLAGAPIRGLPELTPQLFRAVGECLAHIHSVHVDLPSTDVGWWPKLLDLMMTGLSVCRSHSDIADWSDVEQLFRRSIAHRPQAEAQRLAHFDFRLGNLLHVGSKLTGVIDFESSRPALSDFDFTKLSVDVWDQHPDLRAHMLSGYESVRQLVPAMRDNLPLYRLYSATTCLAWCLKRDTFRRAFFEENLRLLQNSVAELRQLV